MWPTLLEAVEPIEEQTSIYVNVSASVWHVLPFVFGLVRHLGERAGRVWQFSNAVGPLSAGRMRTTGGTDFDCLARHALDARRRRVVVITDGEADLSPALERELSRRVEAFVLLTASNAASPLLRAAGGPSGRGRRWWVIPRSVPSR